MPKFDVGYSIREKLAIVWLQDEQGGVKWNIKVKAFADFASKYFPVQDLKDIFTHEYDFGSTTYLDGQVLAVREGFLGKNKIRILARNNPYAFVCDDCGKQATSMCVECEGFVCDQCQDAHECGEEMMLDVVNSPRMGVCGYNGPDMIDEWTP